MEARATARFVRMAPRKVRFVLDTVRGKYASDALDQLKFTPNHAADEIANVIKSAVANAEHNLGLSTDYLKIARCFVDPGPTMKRVQPRAQGRAYRILKRTSHITVILEEGEAPPAKTGKRKEKRAPLRAALVAPAAAEATAPAETTEDEVTTTAATAEDTTTENATAGCETATADADTTTAATAE
jgi:large subunit ribosomal protein L22